MATKTDSTPTITRDSTPGTDAGPEFRLLHLDRLHESPLNPRRRFDQAGLAELTESIRKVGVLTPLLVRPNAGGYEIAAGHRRLRAAKAAGLAEVPALVRPMTDVELLEILVIENGQREGVHPLDEAFGYHALMTTAKYDVATIAARVGRSTQYVYDRVKLLSLTGDAQKIFLDGAITAGHAILLARLKPIDQTRVIGVRDDHDDGALFTHERLLVYPDEDEPKFSRKPVSVRELQAWIDQHVKFDATSPDLPDLFPETAAVVTQAKEQAEKIVPITHELYVQADARDGSRVFGPRSWTRADGTGKAKPCERAVTGVVVIGPGRGEAFKVCTDKQRCTVHWKTEQQAAKARAKAATSGGKTGEARWKIEDQKRKEQHAREEAEHVRWKKALPAILEAVAEKVKKAPARAKGLLAEIVLGAVTRREFGMRTRDLDAVPRGTTAEDLVRHAAFLVLQAEAAGWVAPREFPKRAKAFGVDARKILEEVAPAAKAEPTPGEAKSAEASKVKTRKKKAR